MAKSKNHTNHNQNHKHHRNGIKRPKKHTLMSMRGMCQKFMRNLHFSKKGNKPSYKVVQRNAMIQALRIPPSKQQK